MRGSWEVMDGWVPMGCGQAFLRTSWASPRLSIVKDIAALLGCGQGEGVEEVGMVGGELVSRSGFGLKVGAKAKLR
jgi:hypothetical protein